MLALVQALLMLSPLLLHVHLMHSIMVGQLLHHSAQQVYQVSQCGPGQHCQLVGWNSFEQFNMGQMQ